MEKRKKAGNLVEAVCGPFRPARRDKVVNVGGDAADQYGDHEHGQQLERFPFPLFAGLALSRHTGPVAVVAEAAPVRRTQRAFVALR